MVDDRASSLSISTEWAWKQSRALTFSIGLRACGRSHPRHGITRLSHLSGKENGVIVQLLPSRR
ncbi:Uncharacterised protein [Mycobacteroides abscessus subsp. abscessus]|nr:Uncharacterised protein [Mycobacteroides abscessus subsp. abscessus]SKS04845.1 Uncharacterised protein [Mycobacteroides abscessus subsp. abscessus]SKW00061.1 Uncharacterised protein [Mycobacteroides abscessus subsp. abscessus]